MAKTILSGRAADADLVQRALEKSREGLKPLDEIASALDCPLWVMLIPNMPAAGLSDENRRKLIRLVDVYLDRLRGELRPHPIVEKWNSLRYDIFGPISVVSVVRESLSPDDDYDRWRVLGDAVKRFEDLTGRIEKLAYETALGV